MKSRREKKKTAERNPKNAKILFCETHNRKTGINTLTEKHVSVREMHIIIFLYYLESDECA